jgi:hypothetical protein
MQFFLDIAPQPEENENRATPMRLVGDTRS